MSSQSGDTPTPAAKAMTNGSGAAAVVAAGFGSFVLAVVAIAADKSTAIKSMMNLYRPTGPLSGVTSTAILAWLVLWVVLELRWRNRDVAIKPVGAVAFTLLVLSLLLTFPPISDLF